VTIHQLSAPAGAVVNSWRLDRAWPCRWSGPSFDAVTSGIAYEELELAFDDLVWEASPESSTPPLRSRTPTQGG
jgi:phage tail-like protein